MVVEAHKVLKKRRRQRHRHFYDEEPQPVKDKPIEKPDVIDIFDFPKEEDYSTIIKQIGVTAHQLKSKDNINRSKSCSDILSTNIQTLDHSPRHRRLISISEVFMNVKAAMPTTEPKEERSLIQQSNKETEPAECGRTDNEETKERCSDSDHFICTVPTKEATEQKSAQRPNGRGSRFKIYKVEEEDLLITNDTMKRTDNDTR